jgi:Uncharacterised nucleotidyltransferase
MVDGFAQLASALLKPESLMTLSLTEWDRLIRYARLSGLLARLQVLLDERNLIDRVPSPVIPHLTAARTVADHERRSLSWEVNRIERALAGVNGSCILLKGAAYSRLDLGLARGRISSDVDILVPKTSINKVEKALLDHGWVHIKLDDYDQYFYRRWSHELPPLQHRDRGTVVDVHHTILPPTGRLHPDSEKLIAAAILLEGTRFRVLAPTDMVLHSAAHTFHDGDLTRGFRDLLDIDDLLRHFGQKETFWAELAARAEELDLCRPLYYALRYSHFYLQTPIPQDILGRSKRWQPAWPASVMMDVAVGKLILSGPWRKGLAFKLSQQLLYIRSHWLRMPPHLLIPHLIRKASRKRRIEEAR